mmetsp:Transcript_175359/g.562517  ORF Transcript_175359/g.562517 Transcript_175359/m.562517 type:complete len:263 (+) Transcript_175359:355-1143(+)
MYDGRLQLTDEDHKLAGPEDAVVVDVVGVEKDGHGSLAHRTAAHEEGVGNADGGWPALVLVDLCIPEANGLPMRILDDSPNRLEPNLHIVWNLDAEVIVASSQHHCYPVIGHFHVRVANLQMHIKGFSEVNKGHRTGCPMRTMNARFKIVLVSPLHQTPARDALKDEAEGVVVQMHLLKMMRMSLIRFILRRRRQHVAADVRAASRLANHGLLQPSGGPSVQVLRGVRAGPLSADAPEVGLKVQRDRHGAILGGSVQNRLRR